MKTGEMPPQHRHHPQLGRGLELIFPAPAGDSLALLSALGPLSQSGVILFGALPL